METGPESQHEQWAIRREESQNKYSLWAIQLEI